MDSGGCLDYPGRSGAAGVRGNLHGEWSFSNWLGASGRTPNPEFLHSGFECGGFETEELGCAPDSPDAPPGAFEHLEDIRPRRCPLHGIERHRGVRGLGGDGPRGQSQGRGVPQDDRPLDRVGVPAGSGWQLFPASGRGRFRRSVTIGQPSIIRWQSEDTMPEKLKVGTTRPSSRASGTRSPSCAARGTRLA